MPSIITTVVVAHTEIAIISYPLLLNGLFSNTRTSETLGERQRSLYIAFGHSEAPPPQKTTMYRLLALAAMLYIK